MQDRILYRLTFLAAALSLGHHLDRTNHGQVPKLCRSAR